VWPTLWIKRITVPTKREDEKYETDPVDGFRREIVGSWAQDKHKRLRHYIDISSAARRKFEGNSSYIELYCGPGRSRIKDQPTLIEGSAVAAGLEGIRRAPFGHLHIGDIDPVNTDACRARLAQLQITNVSTYVGRAEETAATIVRGLSKSALHLAFLDPYSIEALPFAVIRALTSVPRMDILIHVSLMDLQRNVKQLMRSGALSHFAPGWEAHIDTRLRNDQLVLAAFSHWRMLLRELGLKVSDNVERVTGRKNQPLYWLVLAGFHPLANQFWDEVSNTEPQARLPLS
jgi:three-Cys-motif partner protein